MDYGDNIRCQDADYIEKITLSRTKGALKKSAVMGGINSWFKGRRMHAWRRAGPFQPFALERHL